MTLCIFDTLAMTLIADRMSSINAAGETDILNTACGVQKIIIFDAPMVGCPESGNILAITGSGNAATINLLVEMVTVGFKHTQETLDLIFKQQKENHTQTLTTFAMPPWDGVSTETKIIVVCETSVSVWTMCQGPGGHFKSLNHLQLDYDNASRSAIVVGSNAGDVKTYMEDLGVSGEIAFQYSGGMSKYVSQDYDKVTFVPNPDKPGHYMVGKATLNNPRTIGGMEEAFIAFRNDMDFSRTKFKSSENSSIVLTATPTMPIAVAKALDQSREAAKVKAAEEANISQNTRPKRKLPGRVSVKRKVP